MAAVESAEGLRAAEAGCLSRDVIRSLKARVCVSEVKESSETVSTSLKIGLWSLSGEPEDAEGATVLDRFEGD